MFRRKCSTTIVAAKTALLEQLQQESKQSNVAAWEKTVVAQTHIHAHTNKCNSMPSMRYTYTYIHAALRS